MLSKPLITSIELDWTWIGELNHNVFKIVQEHEISKNSISQGKRVGLWLSSNCYDL